MELYYNIKEMTRPRLHELRSGDELYCNTKFMEEQKYYYELNLGDIIYIHSCRNNILEEGVAARVIKVEKERTNSDKKWWQFWIKHQEYVTGYNLMIV